MTSGKLALGTALLALAVAVPALVRASSVRRQLAEGFPQSRRDIERVQSIALHAVSRRDRNLL